MYILYWFLARLQEPSTYAGLGSLLVVLGVNLDPGMEQKLVTALIAVAGAAACFLPEGNPEGE